MSLKFFSLSAQQEQLWIIDALNLQRGAYNEGRAFQIKGKLDSQALSVAVTELIRDVPMLRSTFSQTEQGPVRIVRSDDISDIRGLQRFTSSGSTRSTLDRIQDFIEEQYDLDGGALCRFGLAEDCADGPVLAVGVHHILSDGFGFDKIMDGLGRRYSALRSGSRCIGRDDRKPYDDFVRWQQDYFASARFEQDLAYWRKSLGGFEQPAKQLAARTSKPAERTTSTSDYFTIPQRLQTNARIVADELNCTPFAVMMGCYALTIHDLNQAHDIVLGTGAMARPGLDYHQSFGLFSNMLPIRSRICGPVCIGQFLIAFAERYLAGVDHQFVPFDRILAATAMEQDRAYRPLVQHVFTMWEGKTDLTCFEGLDLVEIDVPRSRCRFETLCEVLVDGQKCRLRIEHDPTTTTRDDVKRIAERFLNLLDSLPTHLNSSLDIAAAANRHPSGPPTQSRKVSETSLPLAPLVKAVWAEALGVETVADNDNFFALGGRSIVAVRLSSILSDRLTIHLPIKLLFDYPVLHEYCRKLQSKIEPGSLRDQHESGRPEPTDRGSIQPSPKRAKPTLFPLTQTQLQLWTNERLGFADANDFAAAIQLEIDGPLDSGMLEEAFRMVADRHELLRASLEIDANGLPHWSVADEIELNIPVVDLSGMNRETARIAATGISKAEAARCANSSADRLLQLLLIRLTADRNILIVAQNHLITDPRSLELLLRQWSQAYCAIASQEPWSAPNTEGSELAANVRDESTWLKSEACKIAREFWRETLSGSAATLPQPDIPGAKRQSMATEFIRSKFSASETAALLETARHSSATPFIILLACWAECLRQWTGESTIITGINAENRFGDRARRAIGCFVNPVPLRIDLGEAAGHVERQRAVTSALLATLEHQRLPFREIVKLSESPLQPNRMPVFQTIVDWVEPQENAFDIANCTTRISPIRMNTNRFHLALYGGIENQELFFEVEYSPFLWSKETISEKVMKLRSLLNFF